MSPRIRSLPTAGASLACLLLCQTALADAQTAAAEALFEEGRRLVAAGKLPEACSRLEESQRLDPAIGTQYHLADCWERTGRLASAWGAFLDVSYAARQAGQPDRERAARDRAQALAPRLPRLVIHPPASASDTALQIARDGVLVGKGQWGSAVPVDPGMHQVVASAPGRQTWQASVQTQEASTATLTIPALQPAPAVSPEAPPGREQPKGFWTTRTTSAVALGGLAVAGITVGAIYGLTARSNNEDSLAYCAEKNLCSREGVDLRQQARTDAAVSTVAFSVAGAAALGAVVLWATSPGSAQKPAAARLRLIALPTAGAQLRWEGSW
jgi:tetratricopeptide (TPR) repeat protein